MHHLGIRLAVCLCITLSASIIGYTNDKPRKPRRTVAHSLVSPDYHREKLPNGGWKPETYALGIGRKIDPTEKDESLSELSVDELAAILADALAKQDYLPESDPKQTDLMIVVSWGKTIPFNDSLNGVSIDGMADAMNAINALGAEIDNQGLAGGATSSAQNAQMNEANAQLETMLLMQDLSDRARREANDHNARLLGFAPELYEQYASAPIGGPGRLLYDDLIEEIEVARYFVILQAFDFEKLVNQKEKNLLWVTRFSIRAKGRRFNEELANMAQAAHSLFGAESGKLKRHLLPGDTSLGDIEVVETVEEEEDTP